MSAVFTLAGIPLLLPALDYLSTDVAHERNLGYIKYVESVFGFFGLDTNFFSIVIVATILIFMSQLTLLFVELFSKRVQKSLGKVREVYTKKMEPNTFGWNTDNLHCNGRHYIYNCCFFVS